MTTLLYLLIAALVFFIIGYILAKTGCSTGERYLAETPVDPVTADDGSCEDESIHQAQREAVQAEEAKQAEAVRLQEEEAAAKAEAEAEEAAKRKAEEQAAKEAEAKAAAEAKEEAKAQEEKEKAAKEAAETATAQEDTEKEEAATEEPTATAPEGLLDAPRNGKKDNLTKIKGIGIKIDQALNSIGIYHFDQIAVWTEENMAWADRELAFPGRAKRDNWVEQAKLLAAGKETEFSKRVEKGKVASSKKA